jgi:hypothetical protein
MASLGMVLEQYPSDVVEYVTDPRTGIQRNKTFPPSIAEIVSACEERASYLQRMERYANWGKNNEKPALLEAPRETRPTYADLKARYGENWGIEDPETAKRVTKPAPTIDQLRHHYAHYNLAFKPKDGDADDLVRGDHESELSPQSGERTG